MSRWNEGDTLGPETYRVTRADLVAYAAASGDHNPIHWSDRVASAVGLPGVVAHGMYTLALTGRAVATWAEGADVLELGARFTAPVLVPDDDTGAEVVVTAVVGPTTDGRTRLDVTAEHDGRKVLARARAIVAADV